MSLSSPLSPFGSPSPSPLSTMFPAPPSSMLSPSLSPTSVFDGFTGFGFEIPQGDPHAIDAAATGVRRLGAAFGEQTRALQVAAQVAIDADGGWRGSASAAFAEYASHITGALSANSGVCERAASALGQLSQALAHAQAVTKQALSDCEKYHGEYQTQSGNAQTAAQTHQTAVENAAAAPDPISRSSYNQQATTAHIDQVNAQNAANTAATDLAAAQKRGHDAYEAYMQDATQLAGRIESAAGELRSVHGVHGAAPVPISVTPADVSMASAMMAGAGGLSGAANALQDPAEMRALACGQVDPGTVLAFDMEYNQKLQMSELAAEDKGAQGGFWDVIPGGQDIKTFASDVVSAFTGDAKHAVTGTIYILGHPAGDAQWLWSHSIFAHTGDPIGSQSQSITPVVNYGKQVLDFSAWSHGQYAAGAGNATGNLLFALALWKGPGVVSKAYAAAPEATVGTGFRTADALGATGVGEWADPVSGVATPDNAALLKVQVQRFINDPVGVTKENAATHLAIATLRVSRVTLKDIPETAGQPTVIVVKRLPNGSYDLYGR
jgi:hypothetical protein